MAYQPKNPNGQATMANSEPVVIASNQSAVPVTGTFYQATQPVSGTVTANAGTNLNTSTLALESGGNIASIKAKTDNIPALGQALAASSVPVVLTAAQVTTLTPLSTVAVTQSGTWDEVGINDSGNSITVDNTVLSVVGSGTEATAQRVTIATDSTGVLSVDDNGGSLTIDGTITVGNPGDIGGGTQYTEDAAAAANPVGTAVNLVRQDTPAALVTTDGDNVAQRGTNYGAAYTQVVTSAGAFVDTFGGGTQYTEGDTDATITGTAALVEGAANALAVMTQPLTDTQIRATALPVSGTVTANLSATDNAVLDAIEVDTTTLAGAVSGTEMQVDVLTMPTVTVTATNLDVQSGGADLATSTQAGAIQTSVELIDDTVYTDGTGTVTKGIAILGQDGTNPQAIKTDASGELQVDVLSMPTTAVTGTFWQATQPVSLTSTTVTGTVAVTQSGTWDEVGINDSGNSITVDYATTGSGTATGALRVELPTNGTGVIATVGAVTAITNALPAGTNGIGKLTANSGVDIGDVDVTSIVPGTGATNLGKAEDGAHTTGDVGVFSLGVRSDTLADVSGATGDYIQASHDLKGRVMVGSAPRTLKANQVTTITSSTSETTIVTAVASTFLDLYGLIITNTSATAVNVAIKDGTAGTTRLNIAVPAGDTRGFMLPIDAAIKQSGSNANWTATSSGSVASLVITALTVANL